MLPVTTEAIKGVFTPKQSTRDCVSGQVWSPRANKHQDAYR